MGLNRAIYGRICLYMGDCVIGRPCGDFHGLYTQEASTQKQLQ